MNDVYNDLVEALVKEIGNKIEYKCVILDGSVNNDEHIIGYSDIDIKIFSNKSIIKREMYIIVRDIISKIINDSGVILNVWILSDMDFPNVFRPNMFDFVRRYCLKNGTVILGNDQYLKEIKLYNKINSCEKDLCIKTIANFQIRLRRLITNPYAITDVKDVNVKFLIQQLIAYYFHSVRYFNAYFGKVISSIEANFNHFIINGKLNNNHVLFASKLYNMRKNWDEVTMNLDEAEYLLLDTIHHINELQKILFDSFDETEVELFYFR